MTGKKTVDIIADNEFHPEVVTNEYQRHMKFCQRDMGTLQDRYISSII
jgi:hypothetical protein